MLIRIPYQVNFIGKTQSPCVFQKALTINKIDNEQNANKICKLPTMDCLLWSIRIVIHPKHLTVDQDKHNCLVFPSNRCLLQSNSEGEQVGG